MSDPSQDERPDQDAMGLPLVPGAGWLRRTRELLEGATFQIPVQPEISLRIYMDWNGTDPSDETEGSIRADRQSAIVNQVFRPDILIRGFRIEIDYPDGDETIYVNLAQYRKAEMERGTENAIEHTDSP